MEKALRHGWGKHRRDAGQFLSENLDINSITEGRRKAVDKTIRLISVEEIKLLVDEIFPYPDDPYRERFLEFLGANAGGTFYHATTNDPVHILYCSTKDKGIWFLSGSGVGVLQQRGLDLLKGIVKKL
ncbi:MAG TPA: hypothetical protein VGM54_13750 [Chthoniobacter sp.]|jgi:hypothetical protein